MRPGTRLIGSFAVLLVLQALTSLVAITLLGRMSPAIEHIMQENVVSVEAVEQMALVLAAPTADAGARERYRAALDRARRNVTEPEEAPLLDELSAQVAAALAGDAEARRRSVEALAQLGTVNREAMARARDAAKHLGTAGAWAVTFLALLGLGASYLAVLHARRSLIAPLSELSRVAAAYRAGRRDERCTLAAPDADELALVGVALNELLDRDAPDLGAHDKSALERAALLRLLDRGGEALAVVDPNGELLAASEAAEALLAGPRGSALRDALRRAASRGDAGTGELAVEAIGDTGALLCVLPNAP